MSNLIVAETILKTLGGNKFRMMTGAKNLAGDENSLSMRIGRNSSNSNYLKITLNSMDLYDMKFCKLTRKFEEKSVTEYSDVYNDMFLKKYATALIRKQWGANLSKFGGVQMIGGVTLNGSEIYSQALSDIENLEQRIRSQYELNPTFMIG